MIRKCIIQASGCIALAMALFHLYSGGIRLFPATQQRAVHLAFALTLVFLLYPLIKSKQESDGVQRTENVFSWSVNVLLAACAVFIGVYLYAQYIPMSMRMGAPTVWDIVVGILVLLLTLEATRRILGWALPVIVLCFLSYAFVGHQLPLLLRHSGYSFERIITQVALTNEGVFGIALGVSASYIVLFIMFGAFLERSGAGELFINLALAIFGRFRGGPAKVAVVASSLFGTVSGSQVANVVSTGVLTIPLMKRSGYKPEFAASVEAVSSTGGMFLPPVMGATAFLIAEILRVDYAAVALAAIIPAVLYYFAVFMMVDLRAARLGLGEAKDARIPQVKKLLLERGHLALPLLVLIFLLFVQKLPPTTSAFWSVLSVPLCSWLRKETRMGWKSILESLQQGAKLSLVVAAACAAAGIVIGVINLSGLGLRFTGLLVELASGNLLALLVLTMFASIILGMGLPPVAAYIVLAVLAAPAMIDLGVAPMAAHLFIFYFGILSAITPPVAIASYAAAGIAQSDPFRTSLIAVRLGLAAFLVPFMFVYGPPLLLIGSLGAIVVAFISALVGVTALAISLEGYLTKPIHVVSRCLMFIGALLLINVGIMADLAGLLLMAIVIFYELFIRKGRVSQVKEEIGM